MLRAIAPLFLSGSAAKDPIDLAIFLVGAALHASVWLAYQPVAERAMGS